MILLIFLLVASVSPVKIVIHCPTCLIVHNECYNLTHLSNLKAHFRKNSVVYKLDILRSKNTLFYTFRPQCDDFKNYHVAYIALDSPKLQSGVFTDRHFAPVTYATTIAIDQKTSSIYFSGSQGLFFQYKMNKPLRRYSHYTNYKIDNIFIKDHLYYVIEDYFGVMEDLLGSGFRVLLDYMPVQKFVVNNNDTIVFINSFGLFVGKGETVHRIATPEYLSFKDLAVDLYGEVYAWWSGGIYKVIVKSNLWESELVHFDIKLDLSPLESITFDRDNNMIFIRQKGVFMLKKIHNNCWPNKSYQQNVRFV